MTKQMTPIGRNIIVKMLPRETQSKGGIFIPQVSQHTNTWGEVDSVGPLCIHDLKKGDRVFIPAHLGTIFRVRRTDEFVIIDESKVVCMEPALA
jgi:co-chaperonin GroES (HSP10)